MNFRSRLLLFSFCLANFISGYFTASFFITTELWIAFFYSIYVITLLCFLYGIFNMFVDFDSYLGFMLRNMKGLFLTDISALLTYYLVSSAARFSYKTLLWNCIMKIILSFSWFSLKMHLNLASIEGLRLAV
jgi:ABC-type Co2+ transport system permease subunit